MPTLELLPASRHELWTNDERNLGDPVYRFGEFTLDTRRAALFLSEEELRLRRRTFELLTYLVRNSGRAVSKQSCSRVSGETSRSPTIRSFSAHFACERPRSSSTYRRPSARETSPLAVSLLKNSSSAARAAVSEPPAM